MINNHNEDYEKGIYKHFLGESKFTDWTDEEAKQKLTGVILNEEDLKKIPKKTFGHKEPNG